jgi:DUF4097 and DUF4098 domain-containing protein YvlB
VHVPEGTTLELRTSNGGVTVTGQTGGVKAHASNGRIQIRDSRGLLEPTTSNGGIEIESEHAVVNARTSNGKIHFQGKLAAGDHVLRTSNGSITLQLPEGSQFHLDARTSNGRIRSEFAVRHDGKPKRAQLQGTVGIHPTANLQLQTSNGDIKIERDR